MAYLKENLSHKLAEYHNLQDILTNFRTFKEKYNVFYEIEEINLLQFITEYKETESNNYMAYDLLEWIESKVFDRIGKIEEEIISLT